MSDSKNDIAWSKLFQKHKIINVVDQNGFFIISSSQINEFREARLMTKFDYKSQLPSLFAKNNFSILPTSRGDYIISDFQTFHDFEKEDVELVKVDFPNYIESIDYNNISSESIALNCAYISGIITDFSGEEELKPTVNGRMSSQSFDFKIDTLKSSLDIKVEKSQIEIDGGYEGVNTLCLFEAKNILSNDFLIRQLYYPYRLWIDKVNKEVKTIFLTYSNGIFHLREYLFEDQKHYNSIKLVRQKKYAIREGAINIEIIQKVLQEVTIVEEPQIAFPQADSFERVINLCELLFEKSFLTRDDITENYDFDERQTNYYTDAARYLGLIDKERDNNQVHYFLTRKGNSLFSLKIVDRQIEFIKLILSHIAFKKTLELYFEKTDLPRRQEIIEIMKISNLFKVNGEETFKRRASTISSWINWIMELIEE